MAEIAFSKLVELIKGHPDYQQWRMGAEADQALYVSFGGSQAEASHLTSVDYETSTGLILVLDRDAQGLVLGLEIV